MHIVDLNCTGSEQRLIDCPHNSLIGVHDCGIREDAALRCQGQQPNMNSFKHAMDRILRRVKA